LQVEVVVFLLSKNEDATIDTGIVGRLYAVVMSQVRFLETEMVGMTNL
jgi:hypothetical protein